MKISKDNIVIFSASILIVAIWAFPNYWYTKVDKAEGPQWFDEKSEVPGWEFGEVPIAESAEKALVADAIFSGNFKASKSGQIIKTFSARRNKEDMNEIGLFVHTPDRCWTESGWQMEASLPESTTINIQGRDILFERRIFDFKGHKELVYFTGLVGGQTLPYRLDHNMSVAMKYQINKQKSAATGTSARTSDSRFWARIWESFLSRRKILGPKQFIRVSIQVYGDPQDEEKILTSFVKTWLG